MIASRRFAKGFPVALAALLLSCSAARAQDAPPPEEAPAGPCEATEHAQFDFWVGAWDVSTAKTREAGREPSRNTITKIHGGCALREEYVTTGGYAGSSLNYYDRFDGKWHQTWIDVGGNALRLVGGMEDDSMVMRFTAADGTRNRIAWTPNDDGSVRQHWQRRKGDEDDWTDVFDGRYNRR